MKWQQYDWSCGAASVVNAFRCFGVNIDERQVRPVAGTVAPSACTHCVLLEDMLLNRYCERNKWRCKCTECKALRKQWRSDCDSGTSEEGIVRALRHFGPGFKVSVFESGSKENAWQWLHGSLIHGRFIILCVDRWTHWCLVFGTAGEMCSLFDPYPSKKNLRENGTFVLTKDELMRRWHNGNKTVGKEKRLYAISIGRK